MNRKRRDFLKYLGVGGGSFALGDLISPISRKPVTFEQSMSAESEKLYEEIATYPHDDTHCHAFDDLDAETTPELFLRRISLSGFSAAGYFPPGVFQEWSDGDARTKDTLNRQYNVEETVSEIIYHFSESVFVKYLIKEMAQFLGCSPDLNEIIEARNERGKNYWQYVNDLFQDAKIENIINDTGCCLQDPEDIDTFEDAILPTQSRRIYRIETIQGELFRQDITFDELVNRFQTMVRNGLDGTGNYGKKSYGMKSYLMPYIGVMKPLYDPEIARQSWEEYKRNRDTNIEDREESRRSGKDIKQYLLTLSMEECLERDMPMQFHIGAGAPGVILRNQDPYFLEEMVRFEKDGQIRMPKIIPVHAGYPLVGKAAWLSHQYTNCYLELSTMTPYVHQGLVSRYLQIMEAVPLSKILMGSDAYNMPELFWLTGKWGKRFLSQALAVYVENKLLTREEALEAAKMILYKNNRRVYNLPT
ncbi:twin-arginine translocation signal domain-containing protein [candidate division KSB1 bacterium]